MVGLIGGSSALFLFWAYSSSDYYEYAFPRMPLVATFKHKNTLEEFTVVNVHLKCCEGEGNTARRRDALFWLNEWCANQNKQIVVAGDFNEEPNSGILHSISNLFLVENNAIQKKGMLNCWLWPPLFLRHLVSY